MKSKILILFYIVFFSANAVAENLLIQAKNIKLEKDGMTSVFEDEVKVQTKIKLSLVIM